MRESTASHIVIVPKEFLRGVGDKIKNIELIVTGFDVDENGIGFSVNYHLQ